MKWRSTPPCHMKIRAIVIIALRKAIRVLKIRSKNICDLENFCTIMEERMIKNEYNNIFDNTKRRRCIMDWFHFSSLYPIDIVLFTRIKSNFRLVHVFPLFFAKKRKKKNLNRDIYFRWEYNLRQKSFIKITICET